MNGSAGHGSRRNKSPEQISWDEGRELNLYKRHGRWHLGGDDDTYSKGDAADEFVDIRVLAPCDGLMNRR